MEREKQREVLAKRAREWRSIKYEELYLHDYLSPRQASQGLSRYFDFYNHRRLHQSLDYLTPATVYLAVQMPAARM